jgi:hypothetical protein
MCRTGIIGEEANQPSRGIADEKDTGTAPDRAEDPAVMAKAAGVDVSHSFNFDHRRRPDALRTAIAIAFDCPTRTTSCFPRVTPV